MYRVVTESTAYMKSLAKDSLRNNWKEGTLGFVLFYILTIFIRNVLNLAVDNSIQLMDVYGQTVNFIISGNLYDFLTTPIFTFGIIAFAIVIARERTVKLDLIFSGFEFYGKVLLLGIVMAIKIILWSLLLVVPGIIAALNYSQAYFILFDDHSKGVMQCIEESKMMMRGNKMNLFYLVISFIGWIIVASVITSAVIGISSGVLGSGYFTQIISIIGYIPTSVVMVYIYVTEAHFHDLLIVEETVEI
ncbi:MAG: DUF975 family protein [Clostridia bacterium]|nr:DUF975 family protein [Clostridia bacterium]